MSAPTAPSPPSHPLSTDRPRAPATGALIRAVAGVSTHAAARLAGALFLRTTRPRPRPDEAAWLRAARRHTIPVLGRRIAVYRWEPERRRQVILSHGWWSHAGRFVALADALMRRGFGVVAFDAPGHGASSGWRASMPEFARTLRAVVEDVGPVEAAVGHSLGGAATLFALSRGFTARRAALIAAPADLAVWADRYRDALSLPPQVDARMRELVARHLGVEWHELDLPAAARALTLPALVVHDRDDGDVPIADGRALAAAWPGATLHETAGLGHRKVLRDPDVIRTVADFLDR